MKATLLSLFLFITSVSVFAQEKPVAEIFGGYSYTRIAPDNSIRKENANGGHASLTINSRFLGFTVDFSGHRGKAITTDITAYNLMVGPRFGREGKKISWFMHSLYGASNITSEIRSSAFPNGSIPAGINIPRQSKTYFAFVPGGGGVDVKLNDKIALRLFQADMLFIQREAGISSWHPRFSTGLVIRLGKK
jgi:hypothetical protein